MTKEELLNTINSYYQLEYDWDGYNSMSPSKQTLNNVIRFINNISEDSLIPKPMVGYDGTVGLYLEKDNKYLEICFDDNHAWYYSKVNIEENYGLFKFMKPILDLIKTF